MPEPDRINTWDSIQLSKIYSPLRDKDTTKYTSESADHTAPERP